MLVSYLLLRGGEGQAWLGHQGADLTFSATSATVFASVLQEKSLFFFWKPQFPGLRIVLGCPRFS